MKKLFISINEKSFPVQVEVGNLVDGWFYLTLWYQGRSITERVPQYSMDIEEDIENPHGPLLLKELLNEH